MAAEVRQPSFLAARRSCDAVLKRHGEIPTDDIDNTDEHVSGVLKRALHEFMFHKSPFPRWRRLVRQPSFLAARRSCDALRRHGEIPSDDIDSDINNADEHVSGCS
ncbi:hypothetical protein CEXT_58381 [Caerostris extrusa]|uniref:Uncharacterized protein n=1 Tax=Caerostris extrusa TaxID=172846 RepID=A0AAV4XVK8_CAEEX|nr:hypothetical protein CEXT_58381 [Caerostris extrusa]